MKLRRQAPFLIYFVFTFFIVTVFWVPVTIRLFVAFRLFLINIFKFLQKIQGIYSIFFRCLFVLTNMHFVLNLTKLISNKRESIKMKHFYFMSSTKQIWYLIKSESIKMKRFHQPKSLCYLKCNKYLWILKLGKSFYKKLYTISNVINLLRHLLASFLDLNG